MEPNPTSTPQVPFNRALIAVFCGVVCGAFETLKRRCIRVPSWQEKYT